METVEITIQFADGKREKGFFSIAEQSPWNNGFHSPSIENIDIEEEDLFEALILLRNFLQKLNCKSLCNGARIDVFPSAMSRDMSRGRKAYITRLGENGRSEDLVDIFDFTDSHLISTPMEQEASHTEWFNSLGK